VCRSSWHAVNPSTAVLYRKIDRDQPTLLLDEMDNYPADERRDALAVLNAGYKRGATVDRCRENGDLQEFKCFCPKAYAGLDERAIVPTLLSRSITIRLARKRPDEEVKWWFAPLAEPSAESLRKRCDEWAHHNVAELEGSTPDLSAAGLVNRAAEVWWVVLAIADRVGGDWPQRARGAARALSTGGDGQDESSKQVMLLSDIRDGFGAAEAIFTETLLVHLKCH